MNEAGAGPALVTIDCFPERAHRYVADSAVVAVDVIRATTTATTALDGGWRCFLAADAPSARRLALSLGDEAVLAGELRGVRPAGFTFDNSPATFAEVAGGARCAVLVSTSGTRLMLNAAKARHAYAACLRNWSATVEHLAGRHRSIALIGAGSRGEFREEDQLCCARMAGALIALGYQPADRSTTGIVDRWASEPDDAFVGNKSSKFLADTGQADDLSFIVDHVDDLDAVVALAGNEAFILRP